MSLVMSVCKHCGSEFQLKDHPKGWMANHSRWCLMNPNRAEYRNALEKARASKINFRNQYHFGAVMSEETRLKIGASSTGRTHSEATRQQLRQKALASAHRRLKKGMVPYRGMMFDSSWEVALAKRLDRLDVEWFRPPPLPWVDEQGVAHHYFPDFYLPEFDVYLDPKNPQALRVQKAKVACLLTQYPNIMILHSLEACRTYTPVKPASTAHP